MAQRRVRDVGDVGEADVDPAVEQGVDFRPQGKGLRPARAGAVAQVSGHFRHRRPRVAGRGGFHQPGHVRGQRRRQQDLADEVLHVGDVAGRGIGSQHRAGRVPGVRGRAIEDFAQLVRSGRVDDEFEKKPVELGLG